MEKKNKGRVTERDERGKKKVVSSFSLINHGKIVT